ncbi:MAG: LuxR C-terminal-related transcriptional regulator [Anaerolineae bacterium]
MTIDMMSAQGRNNGTIATRLALNVKMVQNYVSSILSKLQVADQAQAIVRAREAIFGRNER